MGIFRAEQATFVLPIGAMEYQSQGGPTMNDEAPPHPTWPQWLLTIVRLAITTGAVLLGALADFVIGFFGVALLIASSVSGAAGGGDGIDGVAEVGLVFGIFMAVVGSVAGGVSAHAMTA